MKKILTLTVVLAAFAVQSFAQNVEWEEKNFPDKKAFKEARRHYEDGNDNFKIAQAMWTESMDIFSKEFGYLPNGIGELYGEGLNGGGENYRLALDEYLIAYQFNPNSATLNHKIAVCYYNIPSQKLMGLTYAEKALKLNPMVDPMVNYYLGRLYHLTSRWDEAITAYRSYQTALNTDASKNKIKIEDMNRKIAECINGKEFAKKPERVFIDNLGSTVNSPDPEYTPIITADESTMLFTSCRSTTTGASKDDNGQWKEDLYKTELVNGKWSTPVNMGKPVNSDEHDATAGVSPDGQRLYVYRPTKNGDLYESILKGNVWSEPERMNKNINSDGHESTVSLSYDGKKLYFISDKKEEGAIGHRDIWYSMMDEKGKWGKSTNMGTGINTRYGEEGVFVHPDGKTIYFSSQGHKTMGGYDIFKIVFENGKWSEPINLGYPINGPDDDVFFVVSASGKHGYYASSKGDGMGEKDIYKITFLGPEKPLAMSNEDNLLAGRTQPVKQVQAQQTVEVKTAAITILKGTITDINTKKPLGALIELVDNERKEVIATFTANSATGKYLVSLPSGKNYGIAVKMDGYLFHSENFDIPATANFQEVVKDVEMKPIVIGSTIVLKNVFFDYNKATLKPESFLELDRVVKLLTDNPSMRIELSGHTDNTGTETYNQKLSEDRAKSCVDYLISKGIKADRLEYKGYGEMKPIDTNESEAGRANNRRTEFKIIGK